MPQGPDPRRSSSFPGLDEAADTWIFDSGDPSGKPSGSRHLPTPSARYDPGPLLGVGAMGEVVRAWDRHLERHVAMKRLRPELVGRAGVQHFVQEARVMGQLEHPGIVAVHDVGRDEDGRLFFTMEEVRGQRLDEVLADAVEAVKSGSERPDEAVTRPIRVLVRVCEALAFAHARGVVHRDIKPSNIMVGAFGQVRVMDWGLALLREDTDGDAVKVAGTPAYMAPEQHSSETRVGPSADIYAMGVVLVECISGTRPAAPQAPALTVQLPTSGLGGSQLPRELLAVVLRATQPDPADRYPTIYALQRDLEAWLENRPLPSLRYGGLAIFRKWLRRHRTPVIAGTLVAVLATVVLGYGLARYIADVETEANRAQVAEQRARQRLAEAQVASGHALAAGGRQAEARYLYRQGRDSLATMARSTLGARVGLWATHHVARSPLARLQTPPGALLALDPASNRVAALGENGELNVRRLPTMQVEGSWTMAGRPIAVTFESGQAVAYVQIGDRLVRNSPGEGSVRSVAEGARVDATWSVGPGGNAAVAAWGEPNARGTLFTSGRTRSIGAADVHSVSLRHVLAGGTDAPTMLWDAVWGRPLRQVCESACRGVVSPNNDAILVYDEDLTQLRVEDLATGRVRWRRPGKNLHLVRFTPDSRHVVAAGLEPGVEVLEASTGTVVARLEGHVRGLADIAVNDRFIVTRDRTGRALVWGRPTGAQAGDVVSLPGLGSFDIDAQGALIASGNGQQLDLIDAPTRQVLLSRKLAVSTITDVALTAQRDAVMVAARYAGLLRVGTIDGMTSVVSSEPTEAVVVTSDRRVVIASTTGAVAAFALDGGQELWREARAFDGRPRQVALREGRDLVAVAGGSARSVGVWRVSTGRRLISQKVHADVLAVDLSPDGRAVAVTDADGHLHMYSLGAEAPDKAAGARPKVVDLHDGPALSVAFSPGGGSIATGGHDWTVRYLDRSSLELVYTERLHGAPVQALAWLRGDHLYSGASDGRVLHRDLALDGRMLAARTALEGWEGGRTNPEALADALELHDLHAASAAVRQLQPQTTGGWLPLARTQWRAGDLAGARQSLRQALADGPADDAYLELALATLDRQTPPPVRVEPRPVTKQTSGSDPERP